MESGFVIVNVTLLVILLHGAARAVVPVRVRVTEPVLMSAAEGVYAGLSTLGLGENVPVPPVHCVLVTVPVTLPFNVTCWLAQKVVPFPALIVGACSKVICCVADTDGLQALLLVTVI